jgi:hypothetical protein
MSPTKKERNTRKIRIETLKQRSHLWSLVVSLSPSPLSVRLSLKNQQIPWVVLLLATPAHIVQSEQRNASACMSLGSPRV